MQESTLISVERLQALMASPQPPVILDCGFELQDTTAGQAAYHRAHLPGAHYANLDTQLSGRRHPDGPRSPSFTGRHPLPDRTAFAAQAGHWGITPGTQVVCYDEQGSPYAARAWWLLRWLGHSAVAVLDGGKAAWVAAGGPLSDTPPATAPLEPYPAVGGAAMPTVDAATLQQQIGRIPLIDARAPERWRGDSEPLDPVGGHIPGSRPRFFKDNLQADGRFKSPEALRASFAALALSSAEGCVHQCGSGVTACHNLLAMAHAGLGIGTLYPGSWSEWCANPARPIARG
jgi:thiosulfate/3-mercaptopyruvate sulfurtransferase